MIGSQASLAADATPSLEGTWTLKAAYDLHKDGSKTFGFGSAPAGLLMIDHEGRYSLQIYRSNEPTYATDAKGVRTEFKPAEIASTHYGEVHLDSATHMVTFKIERAYNLRWNGTEQVRPYMLSADELSYQVPKQPGSDTVAVSVWQRAQSMHSRSDP
ncbi:lipocalin-like domain-containing protein [Dyella caseinilytica]|uniref:Lipocalin-like domain-containing protein n=2 Tax=Dyella caseinilytica TaxID=1849581 RepID=A0ABX7H0R6_9GAMM|nr:lipocalin-like domain-containing protein [Dyella caseinilytica]